ncbi:type II TA system antitoxin MqsA family protein [Clostridium sp. DL1XJH146]
MKKTFCPKCNKEVEYLTKKNMIKEYKKVKVNVEETIAFCPICGENIFVTEIERENLKRLYDEYRKITGIVSPQDIVNLRTKYDISQRELVSILGWGKMTINRYERGSLPSLSHSDVLKTFISNEEVFKEKVEESYNFGRINEKTYNKLKNAFGSSARNYAKLFINSKLAHLEDINNGFRKFDLEKVENLISYIADKVDNLYKTSLNKYLWYIDFDYFEENVRSITGLRYVKQQYGPVIEGKGYEDVINLFDSKYYKEEFMNSDGSITAKISSKKNYDMSMFSDEELNIIDKVINKFANMSCGEMSQISHQENGWINNDIDEIISYDYAEELKTTF